VAVANIWREYRLQPWRSETFKFSTDPELDAKVRDVVGLHLAPPAKIATRCVRVPRRRTRNPAAVASTATGAVTAISINTLDSFGSTGARPCGRAATNSLRAQKC
jgi:hypothetical protein